MKYIIYILLYLYIATSFIIGIRIAVAAIKADKYVYEIANIIFAVFVGMFYMLFWLPELLADIVAYITNVTR